jgi:NitT/TauT family transport system substrate-binding protein
MDVRRLHQSWLLALSAVLLMACGQAPPAPAAGPAPAPPAAAPRTAAAAPATPTTIKLAVPTLDLNYLLPLSVAEKRGFFREAGLDVEVREMPSTPATAALMNRELDIGCHSCAIQAAARGADLRFVFAPYNTTTFQLVVDPSKIREPKDLVGQAIAIASVGNSQDVATRLTMESLGVDPLSVSYVALGGEGGRVAGMLSGQIAASAMNPDVAIRLKREGMAIMASTAKVYAIPWSGYGVHADYLRDNASTLQGWLRAMIQALVFVRREPDAAADIAAEAIHLDKEIAREAVPLLLETMYADDPGGWTEAGLQEMLRIMRDTDPELKDREIPSERVADVRPLREAQHALGIQCKGGYGC